MAQPRPLSQLIYLPIHEGNADRPLITLHDSGQFAKEVGGWGQAISPDGRVIALESYKGVFVGKQVVGYTWFLGPEEAPSPIFFGDSLAEIERFLWDEIDRSGEERPVLPWLVGIGQGGIMSIATALAVPELISGVVAVDAFLPRVGGWNPPLAPLNNLPILLVNPRESDNPRVCSGDNLRHQLEQWGAHAEVISGVTSPESAAPIATQVVTFGHRLLESDGKAIQTEG